MSQSSAARATARPVTRPASRGTRTPVTPPRLRVVSLPRQSRSRAPLAFACAGLLVLSLVTLLLLNITLSRGSYELYQLESEHTRLAERQQTLQEQLDALAAPQHLARKARGLGMVPAPGPAFVRLSDGDVLGVPERAGEPTRSRR